MELLIVILYIAVLITLAYVNRKSVTLKDYLVSQKSYGSWMTALAARTTGESGWLILGLTGLGYTLGMQGIWVIAGETICVGISWLFMARIFKKKVEQFNSVSVFDFFESRIGDSTSIIRVVSTIVVFILVPIYLAAQFSAMGKTLYVFFDLNHTTGIIIGACIITFYTVVGGFKTVSFSNSFQAVVMIVGLFLVALVGGIALYNSPNVAIQTQAIDPHFFSIWGNDGFGFRSFLEVISFFAIGFGFLGIPHIYVRFIAVKDTKSIRKGVPIAVLYTSLGDSFALAIGIFGRYLLPDLADGEFIFPMLAKTLFHPVLIGFIVIVVLAAIMSTADSLLILLTTTMIRDIFQKLLNRQVEEKKLINASKLAMVFMAIMATFAACGDNRLIFTMVIFAWSALASAFNPLMIMSLTKFKIGKYSAAMGVASGCLTAIIWGILATKVTGLGEMIPGFIVSFSVIILGSIWEKRRENLP